jgi:hypothetical protein
MIFGQSSVAASARPLSERVTHYQNVVDLIVGFFETLPNQIGQPVTEDSNVRVGIDFGDLQLRRRRRQARPGLGLRAPRAPRLHIRPRVARWWCVGARPARLIRVRSAWCVPRRPRKILLLRVLLRVEARK